MPRWAISSRIPLRRMPSRALRRWRRGCARGRSTSMPGRSTSSGRGSCCGGRSRRTAFRRSSSSGRRARENDAGADHRAGDGIAVRAAERRGGERGGHAAGDRGGGQPAADQRRARRFCLSMKSTGSTKRSRMSCCRMSRAGSSGSSARRRTIRFSISTARWSRARRFSSSSRSRRRACWRSCGALWRIRSAGLGAYRVEAD